MFHFQKLDVYQCAVRFLPLAYGIAERAGKGKGKIADQLRRAALSINLNIAEGTGRFDQDQIRFLTTARGSALECAAIFDAVAALGLVPSDALDEALGLLVRIVEMLTKLMKR